MVEIRNFILYSRISFFNKLAGELLHKVCNQIDRCLRRLLLFGSSLITQVDVGNADIGPFETTRKGVNDERSDKIG